MEQCKVTSVQRAKLGRRLVTPGGDLWAGQVVLVTNGHTDGLVLAARHLTWRQLHHRYKPARS